jgi:hypothetical protein
MGRVVATSANRRRMKGRAARTPQVALEMPSWFEIPLSQQQLFMAMKTSWRVATSRSSRMANGKSSLVAR